MKSKSFVYLGYYDAYINETDLEQLNKLIGICPKCNKESEVIEPCCGHAVTVDGEVVDVEDFLVRFEKEKDIK